MKLSAQFATEVPELVIAWRSAAPPDPQIVVLNDALAAELGLDPDWLRSPAGVDFLTGTAISPGSNPVAQGYAGHQFGGYSPRLGDGRALLLGELTTPAGELRDLHLKGSGPTPFARGGDGWAVLGPMLREYVISEALHYLNIPTTRSLAVIATGRAVNREAGPEPGGLLVRVAASHLRVGSFEYASLIDRAAQTSSGQTSSGQTSSGRSVLAALADHAIARHYPELAELAGPVRYVGLLRSVSERQARLLAQWMLVGFIHGVMNTDNMSISGESIDFGPCAFLEAHDQDTVFSSIDTQGRYRYGNQPGIAQWNLARLAEALLPLLAADPGEAIEIAQDVLGNFAAAYTAAWAEGVRAKLGLPDALAETEVVELGQQLLEIFTAEQVDHTLGFRSLAGRRQDAPIYLQRPGWLDQWRAHSPRVAEMDRANPLYIARNHLTAEALRAATHDDLQPLTTLLDALGAPFDERPGLARFAEPGSAEFSARFRTFCGT